MSASVVVLGGAGYVGSHMTKALARGGCTVTVFDNFSNGDKDVEHYAKVIRGDLRNPGQLAELFAGGQFDAVMHFAALCYVGESMLQPQRYFDNNVTGTLNLLDAMGVAGVKRLVFSSTCSTYGEPVRVPIDEGHPQKPVNPYGETKLTAERAMAEQARANGLKTVSLRYFNAAGCDPEGELGEEHHPETHLIPLILAEALRVRAGGEPEETGLLVNGEDFPTPDGSCVRDYVHVTDLCEAHLLALGHLMKGGAGFEAFNLGTETGYSVKQVVKVCRDVTGVDIRYKVGPRRMGDPAALVASARKAREVLGWTPRLGKLEDIVRTAWNWFSAHVAG